MEQTQYMSVYYIEKISDYTVISVETSLSCVCNWHRNLTSRHFVSELNSNSQLGSAEMRMKPKFELAALIVRMVVTILVQDIGNLEVRLAKECNNSLEISVF